LIEAFGFALQNAYRNPLLIVLAVLLVFSTPSISLKPSPALDKVKGANMLF
jgi:hypothetical protein